MRVPWTARRSNQSILKEINPEYSLEGLMLGKIEDKQRRVKRDEMVGWPTLESIHDYWKKHALTRWTLVSKVISLLLNMHLGWS